MKINFAGPANTTVRNKICSTEIFLKFNVQSKRGNVKNCQLFLAIN